MVRRPQLLLVQQLPPPQLPQHPQEVTRDPLHCQGDKGPEHTQGRQFQPSHLQAHQMLEQEDWTGALKTLPHPFGQSSKWLF